MTSKIKWLRIGCIALAGSCMIGDFALFRTAFFNADYVQSFNELEAIRHGNILLHDWSVTADNFYLTDLPFYVFLSFFVGANPALIYIVPYIVFLLFVTGCALLVWRAGSTPEQRFFGVLAVLVIFGMPYGWPQSVFMVSNEHGAGIMYSVFAILMAQTLLRKTALNPLHLGLFCLIVFIMAASDQLADAYFVLPYFVIFVLRAWIYRGTSGQEVLIFGYLVAATLLGTTLPGLIARHGGFTVQQNFSLQLISFIPDAFRNAVTIFINLTFLFDARRTALSGMDGASLIAAARGAVMFGLIVLCGRVLWRLPLRRADVITQWLVFGVVIYSLMQMISQFFAVNASCDMSGPPVCGIRFVAPVFIFLALAGILEGQIFAVAVKSTRLRNGFAVIGAVASLMYFAGGAARVWQAASQPAFAKNTAQVELAQWLAARKLNYGVSDYWTSQLITAFSAGRVKTDTIIVTNKIEPGNWIGDMADLKAGRRPQFVVFGTGNDGFQAPGTHDIDIANISQAYGAPAEIYAVGPYQVALLRSADQ